MVDFAGGSGTALDPYLVATAEQLNEVRNNLSAHFKQTADISLAGYQAGEGWVPIGNSSTKFTGSYDGDFKEITGLKINRPSADYQGLFGGCDSGTIKNIILYGDTVVGEENVGGLFGLCAKSSVENCAVFLNEISGNVGHVGGFAGSIWNNAFFESCYCVVDNINGGERTGGFIGYSNGGIVKNCYSNVPEISNGNKRYLAGFIGATRNQYGDTKIEKCYCVSKITNLSYKDAFAYPEWGVPIHDGNFFDKTVAEIETSNYATGKTTAEMQDIDTFLDAGWDFNGIWYMPEDGGYPELRAFIPPPPPPPVLESNKISLFWGAL